MTQTFNADYFDARTSRRWPVTATVSAGRVDLTGVDEASFDVTAAHVQPRIGHTPVRIALPNGGLLVTRDFAAVESLFTVPVSSTLAHRLESHAGFVVLALACLVAAIWLAYDKGIPWAANQAVERLSRQAESRIADDVMAAVDNYTLEPSQLARDRRAEVATSFAALLAHTQLPPDTRLELRQGGLFGANAFALPGGVIVVTDELADLMNDQQLAAVIAHELGHLEYRHSLRQLIGASFYGLFSLGLFGDASALASLAAAVPGVLVTSSYSRAFEREADAFAVQLLLKMGRSPDDFALALEVLREGNKTRDPLGFGLGGGYLSSHPGVDERIEAARSAAR